MNLNKRVVKQVEDKAKFNTKITQGLAKYYLEKVPYFLDTIIRTGVQNLNPNIPFKYHGWRYLSAEEDYKDQFKSSSTKTVIDIAKNTLYKIEFKFEFDGKEFSRVLLLPYVEKGGVLTLSDAIYAVVPVLTEYTVYPTNKEVFVRLLKDKLVFKRQERNILINGIKTAVPIIHSYSYKLSQGANDKVPMALYLFVKNGFYGVFEKYFNTKPIVKGLYEIVADEEKEKYTVFESTGIKPRILQDPNYEPHGIKILVEKDKVNPFMESIIGSLIYSFDIINRFSRNLPDILNGRSRMDEKMFWMILLGKVIFRNKYTNDKIIKAMTDHVSVINTYLDSIIEEKLKESGIFVEDFFDLIAYIIRHYNELVINSDKRSSSLDNRYIDIIYYVAFEIMSGINKIFYGINKEYNKKGDKLNFKDIESLFNKHMTSRKIFNLIKAPINISLMPIDYSGDNYYPKITAILEDQNRAKGIERDSKAAFPPFARILHAEDLYMGNVLYIVKKSPSPRFRVNPFMELDINTGKIKMDNIMREKLDKLERMLSGKFEDSKILEKEHLEDFSL
jgi:hypothetical protein